MPQKEPPIVLTEDTPEWLGRLLELRACQRLADRIWRACPEVRAEDFYAHLREELEDRLADVLQACPVTLEQPILAPAPPPQVFQPGDLVEVLDVAREGQVQRGIVADWYEPEMVPVLLQRKDGTIRDTSSWFQSDRLRRVGAGE